jgi:hypothetical protein
MKDKYFKLKVFTREAAKRDEKAMGNEKFCERARQPLPCVAADALPYLTLADIVKRKSHVEASCTDFTPFVCPACCL